MYVSLWIAAQGQADCPDPAKYALKAPMGPLRVPAGGSCAVAGGSPCGDHVVMWPSARHSRWRSQLFVFLPGSQIEPGKHEYIASIAAYAGFRTIGLSYDSTWSVSASCQAIFPMDPDCDEEGRHELIFGTPPAAPLVQTLVPWAGHPQAFDPADSVVQRLVGVLETLYADDLLDGIDDRGWGEFLTLPPPGGAAQDVVWDRIVIGGFSQGAHHAAYLSKVVSLQAAVMIEGPKVFYAGVPAPWVSYAAATESCRLFGARHPAASDAAQCVADWDGLGILADEVDVDAVAAPFPPFHRMRTEQQGVVGGCLSLAHGSMAQDDCMPTDAVNGLPSNTPDAAWLFEPYLAMFCAAGDVTGPCLP